MKQNHLLWGTHELRTIQPLKTRGGEGRAGGVCQGGIEIQGQFRFSVLGMFCCSGHRVVKSQRLAFKYALSCILHVSSTCFTQNLNQTWGKTNVSMNIPSKLPL